MRGRTLSHAYVVLDEAQNATSMQMKMFLTRLGEGSRMVITGDISQIDLPQGVSSGLSEAEKLLKDIPKISFLLHSSKMFCAINWLQQSYRPMIQITHVKSK